MSPNTSLAKFRRVSSHFYHIVKIQNHPLADKKEIKCRVCAVWIVNVTRATSVVRGTMRPDART